MSASSLIQVPSPNDEGPGVQIREVCRRHYVTEQTYFRWRRKFGELEVPDARKLKALEALSSRGMSECGCRGQPTRAASGAMTLCTTDSPMAGRSACCACWMSTRASAWRSRWREFYNHRRPHSSLGNRTPVQARHEALKMEPRLTA